MRGKTKMKSEQDPCLCCGQRGRKWADIKVQRMDRDEREDGLEAIWNNRKSEIQDRERARRGREEEVLNQRKEGRKAEGKRESDWQWDRMKCHVTSVRTHTHTHCENVLSQSFYFKVHVFDDTHHGLNCSQQNSPELYCQFSFRLALQKKHSQTSTPGHLWSLCSRTAVV